VQGVRPVHVKSSACYTLTCRRCCFGEDAQQRSCRSAEATDQVAGAPDADADALAKDQIDHAVDAVAEMQLTSDQLKAGAPAPSPLPRILFSIPVGSLLSKVWTRLWSVPHHPGTYAPEVWFFKLPQDSLRKLNALRGGFAATFAPPPAKGDKPDRGNDRNGTFDPAEAERAVRQRAIDAADALQARARREIGQLPFTS